MARSSTRNSSKSLKKSSTKSLTIPTQEGVAEAAKPKKAAPPVALQKPKALNTESFELTLSQGGVQVSMMIQRSRARQVIRAVQKRNLQALPLTIVDDSGLAHTFRSIDHITYPADLLASDEKLTSI